MKGRRKLFGVLLMIIALVITQLPMENVAAAEADFKMSGTTLVQYRGKDKNVSIPDNVEVISSQAFEENDTIELVVVPNSVKRIDAYAFWGCDNLEKIVLGRGLTQIGDFSFTNCHGLKDITIPENVNYIGIQAFADCVNLEDITIPVQVTDIHETAFDGCTKLVIHCEPGSYADDYAKVFYEKQKEMPEYEDIPEYSEEQPQTTPTPSPQETATPSPEPIEDPNAQLIGSVTVVGNHAVLFIDNTRLKTYGAESQITDNQEDTEPEHNESDKLLNLPGNSIAKYCIVDGKVVADQAYYKNYSITEIHLPVGITEIGQFSFARSGLDTINIPSTVENICYGAFYHCEQLSHIVLPESVMNVEPKAFSYTGWVEEFLAGNQEEIKEEGDFLISGGVLVAYRGTAQEVYIPDTVRIIGAEAFQGHGEINKVTLPDSLKVIGEGAFENCINLSEIVFGEQVTDVKDRAFWNCSLRKAVLPKSVSKIGIKSFDTEVSLGYQGTVPLKSYETSAQRLSNEQYREYPNDNEEGQVRVAGLDYASASLAGANHNYTLSIRELEQSQAITIGFERNLGTTVPDEAKIYELELVDNSRIPLVKLGKQILTVILPLPETSTGGGYRVIGLDRNGQLNVLNSQMIIYDGRESIRFETNQISQIAICPTGLLEDNITIIQNSEPVPKSGFIMELESRPLFFLKWLLAGAIFIFGCYQFLQKRRLNHKFCGIKDF